jgi:hypothetical protein
LKKRKSKYLKESKLLLKYIKQVINKFNLVVEDLEKMNITGNLGKINSNSKVNSYSVSSNDKPTSVNGKK